MQPGGEHGKRYLFIFEKLYFAVIFFAEACIGESIQMRSDFATLMLAGLGLGVSVLRVITQLPSTREWGKSLCNVMYRNLAAIHAGISAKSVVG